MSTTTTVADSSTRRIDAGLQALRKRLTVLAILVVAGVLTVTGVALVRVQEERLIAGVDNALRARARETAAFSNVDFVPVVNDEDQAIQVVDLQGNVIASSENVDGLPAMAEPPEGEEAIRTVSALTIEDDAFRVLSMRFEAGESTVIVHIADNMDDINDSIRILSVSLLGAIPVVLAALGTLTWWLVGRTLQPVREAALKQERFVGDASHELRSPLARIRTRLEVDLAHPEGVDLTRTAADVLNETIGMQRLTDDLLDLARGSEPPTLVALDLGEIVAAVAQSVDLSPQLVEGAIVAGDRPSLTRLVTNLVENATHHASQHGAAAEVRVALTRSDGQILLTVDDDGPGIDLADRGRVFDRFTRVDTARTPGGGVGLGLAIVREITEAHHGSILITSSDLGGARIEVRLPAAVL